MKKVIMTIALIAATQVTGCASVTRASSDADLLAKEFIVPSNGSASVYIYTFRGTDLASGNNIYADGVCIAQLNNKAFTQIQLPAGEHIFGMESYKGANELITTLEPNSITVLAAHSAAGFSYYLTEVETEDIASAKENINSIPLVQPYVCRPIQ
ncbi:hypothetical protein A165_04060 [Vibrio tasmaniensis ZS-17]|uniref:DUF2846 domain-containing protein n=1 Tax=Vibrio tasmaniensis TaxID=212663 RepID=UPI0002FE7CC8|nr:DUF2846 domain-containing protein [Vibrio tasmaniensis]OED66391.1 hypothetical protein A165_04060 [Vibrio tasmaniensis ZS-17]